MMILKTIWYAIISRLQPLFIDVNDLIRRIKDGTDNYCLYNNNNAFYLYDFDIDVKQRIQSALNNLNVKNVTLHIISMPYSFYYIHLKRFVSGVGIYNYQQLNICAVSKYSFLKKEYYPYLEHEIAHATGLLKYDHSNLNEFIKIIKYR